MKKTLKIRLSQIAAGSALVVGVGSANAASQVDSAVAFFTTAVTDAGTLGVAALGVLAAAAAIKLIRRAL